METRTESSGTRSFTGEPSSPVCTARPNYVKNREEEAEEEDEEEEEEEEEARPMRRRKGWRRAQSGDELHTKDTDVVDVVGDGRG